MRRAKMAARQNELIILQHLVLKSKTSDVDDDDDDDSAARTGIKEVVEETKVVRAGKGKTVSSAVNECYTSFIAPFQGISAPATSNQNSVSHRDPRPGSMADRGQLTFQERTCRSSSSSLPASRNNSR